MSIGYIARQPILNNELETWGYELLFRAGEQNSFGNDNNTYDGTAATIAVINNTLLDNIRHITKDGKYLINFTRELLLNEYAELLPSDGAIIEILEDIVPDDDVITACKIIRKKGYSLALDDFTFDDEYHDLLTLVDIVKIDFRDTGLDELQNIVKRLKAYNVTLLAEKVETYEEYEYAREAGFTLFQGYFFSKPVMVKREEVFESKFIKLQLLSEINSREYSVEKIEAILKSDPILIMRLLKYINSVHFSLRSKVKSIQQAIVMLGPKRIKRWITVMTASDLSEGKPDELFRESMFRAKFCEILGGSIAGNSLSTDEFFISGLLSYVDAFFGQPKDELLADLPISDQIKGVLLGYEKSGYLANSLELAQALGYGMWDYVDIISAENNIDGNLINSAYLNAVREAADYYSLIV